MTTPSSCTHAAAALLLAFSLAAQDQADALPGTWVGAIQVGGISLRVALHVQAADGGYTATFDSLTQNALGIPVRSLVRDGDRVTAELPGIGARYTATLVANDGSRRLDGTWSQGGRSIELDLEPGEPKAPARPQHPTGDVPYRVEQVAFGHDPGGRLETTFRIGPGDTGVTLAGTLTLPTGDGPHPAVVLISGSGPQDRDETILGHKPFWVIADHLTRRGIAVLRYDDRGTAESTGDFAAATSADFADDARAALRYLATRSEIDATRLGLVGHSEGGYIAPMVASGPDAAQVAFAVLIAPPAVGIADVIEHQSRLIGQTEGQAATLLETNVRISRAALDAIAKHATDDAARREALDALVREWWPKLPEEAQREAGDVDAVRRQLDGLDTPWMRWLLRYDPIPALRAMRCPTFALFGGKDLQVDPAQNRPPLEAAFAGRDVPLRVVTLDGHNHLFQRTETGKPTEYGTLEETFSPEALQRIGDWIAETLRAR